MWTKKKKKKKSSCCELDYWLLLSISIEICVRLTFLTSFLFHQVRGFRYHFTCNREAVRVKSVRIDISSDIWIAFHNVTFINAMNRQKNMSKISVDSKCSFGSHWIFLAVTKLVPEKKWRFKINPTNSNLCIVADFFLSLLHHSAATRWMKWYCNIRSQNYVCNWRCLHCRMNERNETAWNRRRKRKIEWWSDLSKWSCELMIL